MRLGDVRAVSVAPGGPWGCEVKIELYYFDDCPSHVRALDNLKEAQRLEQVPEQVDLIPVTSETDAQSKRFIGSPTIRIDGVDVEGPEAEKRGYGFGCRVYVASGRTTGWPSVAQIRQALQSHGDSRTRPASDGLPGEGALP